MRRGLLIAALVVLTLVVGVSAGVALWRRPAPIPLASAGVVLAVGAHPDDETYAMGQAIAEHALAGRTVVGVLLTDGEGSSRVPEWLDEHGADLDGDGDVDRWDFGLARRSEYMHATDALGIDEVVFLGASDTQGEQGYEDGSLGAEDVSAELEAIAAAYDEIAYLAPMKHLDGRPVLSEPEAHPDHTAVFDAVAGVAEARGEEAFFYKTYIFYGDDWWDRWAPVIVRGSDEAYQAKLDARDSYSTIGRWSTTELWESSGASRVEYLVRQSDL